MKLIPVIALIDEDTHTALAPLISDLIARFDAAPKSTAWERAMLLNGWDHESIAWGLVIAAASREDLEIVQGRGQGDDE